MSTTNQTNQAASTPAPALYDLAAPADTSVEMEEVGGLENFPIYGVTDFKKGVAVRGMFLGNQPRGKDEDGAVRQVHVFANPKTGAKFGIWERTTTASRFANIPTNTLVDVVYEGQMAKHPTDPKKSPPHVFKVLKAKA